MYPLKTFWHLCASFELTAYTAHAPQALDHAVGTTGILVALAGGVTFAATQSDSVVLTGNTNGGLATSDSASNTNSSTATITITNGNCQ